MVTERQRQRDKQRRRERQIETETEARGREETGRLLVDWLLYVPATC